MMNIWPTVPPFLLLGGGGGGRSTKFYRNTGMNVPGMYKCIGKEISVVILMCSEYGVKFGFKLGGQCTFFISNSTFNLSLELLPIFLKIRKKVANELLSF